MTREYYIPPTHFSRIKAIFYMEKFREYESCMSLFKKKINVKLNPANKT